MNKGMPFGDKVKPSDQIECLASIAKRILKKESGSKKTVKPKKKEE